MYTVQYSIDGVRTEQRHTTRPNVQNFSVNCLQWQKMATKYFSTMETGQINVLLQKKDSTMSLLLDDNGKSGVQVIELNKQVKELKGE